MEFNDTKDDHKAIDIEIPTLIDGQSEFGSELKEEEEPVNVIPSGNSGFFMIDEEQTSKISKQKIIIANESDLSDGGLGSFPQKFAYYDNNTFFAEHLLEERKIEKKNINFVNDEMRNEDNLFIFKKILKVIEKHMNDSFCPLNFLRDLYIGYLRENYKPTSSLFDISERVYKGKNELKILKDIDCFLTVYKGLLIDFYHISTNMYISTNPQLKAMFSNESFRYFVINSFFNIDSFYDIAFEAEKKKNYKEEEDLQDGLSKFPNLKLSDFGVSEEFLLDENPLAVDKIKLDYSIINYTLALDCIKNLQYIKSPVHKLKSVVVCGLMIKKSIEDFYFKIHKKVTNNMILPRELVRIVCFAVYKSKTPCMITHLNMMQEFLHKGVFEKLKVPFFKYFKIAIDFFKLVKVMPQSANTFSNSLRDFLDDHDLA